MTSLCSTLKLEENGEGSQQKFKAEMRSSLSTMCHSASPLQEVLVAPKPPRNGPSQWNKRFRVLEVLGVVMLVLVAVEDLGVVANKTGNIENWIYLSLMATSWVDYKDRKIFFIFINHQRSEPKRQWSDSKEMSGINKRLDDI